MPEEVEAEQPAQNLRLEAFEVDLGHHGAEPQETHRHMQPVQADESEEGREKALRSGPFPPSIMRCKFLRFQKKEAEAKEARDEEASLESKGGCERGWLPPPSRR